MGNTDKTIVLISSLGNSELELNGENQRANPKNPDEMQFREKTKKILDDYDNKATNLSLPIQTPIIKKIKERSRKNPDYIFFVYTDQAGEYNKQDTVYAYEIVRKLLAASVPNIHGISIDSNPSDYDNVYNDLAPMILDRVGEVLKQNGISEKNTTVYLNITGGTPAFTLGPTLRCIQKYDDFFTIYKPNEKKSAEILDLASGIRDQLISEDMIAATELYQYKVAGKLTSRLNTDDKSRGIIQAICDYAHARTNMAMEEAERILNMALSSSQYGLELEQLHKKYSDKYIDLYYNTLINLDKGEYIDFLSRLYTFVEVVIRAQLMRATNIKEVLKSNDALDEDKLNKPEYSHIRAALLYKGKVPTYLGWASLGNLMEKAYPDEINANIRNAFKNFDKLKDTRNRNMHKLEGVKLADITGEKTPFLNTDSLRDNMWNLLSGLTDIPKGKTHNPYRVINKTIKQILMDSNCYRSGS